MESAAFLVVVFLFEAPGFHIVPRCGKPLRQTVAATMSSEVLTSMQENLLVLSFEHFGQAVCVKNGRVHDYGADV